MTEKSKTVDLTVSVSFSEGFSESFSDLISRRLLDFEGDVVDALTRRLNNAFAVTSSSGADNSVVCGISLGEFDERLKRALKCALEALSAPSLTETIHACVSADARCADDEG